MIEIYLFVNPLGEYCFEMEQQLLQFIEEEYGTPSKKRCNFAFFLWSICRQLGMSCNKKEFLRTILRNVITYSQ